MELPVLLRQAVDQALEGVALPELTRAAAALSERYRGETRDGRLHLSDDLAAKAYLATRLPATYAAIRAALTELAARRPDFAPRSLLDVGAGPGTALWAAADSWPSLASARLFEASGAIRKWGETLAEACPVADITWQSGDAAKGIPAQDRADLVSLTYVLSELAPETRTRLIDDLWTLTGDVLLLVEPGTPKGWERILAARDRLIAQGARLLAPCPHHLPCPIKAPDWCHFSRRVARSRLHRLSKQADVPWEDEKFIYLAASRQAGLIAQARIVAPPRAGKGRIDLKLCEQDGVLQERTISKRDGALFKSARRRDWGEIL
ncbi:methyltransferase type 11 [Nordella sp. HKS 07]|uniref:small ribosomal subunit Rsm22 family protein n=1 Tax=Nordella sp. HKS 07 TaxID=2712222 RepID=UPI0013E1B4AF|nr:small ribosomal subunit Rsm22 family protein [Nordella sp. HKS 07]QIG46406.1 methyltransferase type 11 [Nordella sp. HKS 07]